MKKKKICAILAVVLCLGVFVSANAFSVNASNIVKGDTSENIKIVQTRLNELGYYNSTIDGIWGSITLNAVKEFQRRRGLIVDGIVGANTESALGITLTTSTSGTGANSVTSSDLELLARAVYSESRGEPYTGQVAVAAVVLNRVNSSSFPNSISGVIYQPYAFTAVSDGQINLLPDDNAYNAARDALNGSDPTNGCLYYYNPATATSKWIWSLTVELTIGSHSFARA